MAGITPLTKEQFQKLIPPRVALERLLPTLKKSDAVEVIIRRIRAYKICAFAEVMVKTSGAIPVTENFVIVFPEFIANGPAANSSDVFWRSGDITFVKQTGNGMGGFTVKDIYNFVNVRFVSQGIDDLVLDVTSEPLSGEPRHAIANNPEFKVHGEAPISEEASTKPPASSAKMKRWHMFFHELYPPELQTEEAAIAHARATFPTNHVSRKSVRDARGPQTPGKKPRGSAEQ